MKKILFYIGCIANGGAERVMANIINYLANKDYDLILVTDVSNPPGYQEYSINPNVKRLDLGGIAINKLPSSVKRIFRLRRIIKSENPNVILSFMKGPNIRMLLSCLFIKIKKVVSIRSDPVREYSNNKISQIFYNILFSLANYIVFQTNDAMMYFQYININKKTIILNPVNPIFYTTKLEKKEKNILYIGRLDSPKNPLLAVKAFHQILSKYHDYKLIYYGVGELEEEIKKYCHKYNLEKNVILAGRTENVHLYLASATCFILTSNYEGLPNSLMEAMAMGVPCISTDCPCGGPRALIKNSKQGVLVPVNNINKLANAIDYVLNDEKIQYELSINEKIRAEDFKYEKIMTKWESVIIT